MQWALENPVNLLYPSLPPQAKRLGRVLEALEAPFLFMEAGAQAGAWRVLHANAPAVAALGAPALQLPAPLWEVFTAVGPDSQVGPGCEGHVPTGFRFPWGKPKHRPKRTCRWGRAARACLCQGRFLHSVAFPSSVHDAKGQQRLSESQACAENFNA